MLKLPMGCAAEGSGNSIRPNVAIAAETDRTKWALVDTGCLPRAYNDILLRQPSQGFSRSGGIKNVEVRVDVQCAPEIFLCFQGITESFVNHARVEEQLRVLCSLLQGVGNSFGSPLKFVILEHGPRQYVPGVN